MLRKVMAAAALLTLCTGLAGSAPCNSAAGDCCVCVPGGTPGGLRWWSCPCFSGTGGTSCLIQGGSCTMQGFCGF